MQVFRDGDKVRCISFVPGEALFYPEKAEISMEHGQMAEVPWIKYKVQGDDKIWMANCASLESVTLCKEWPE